MRKFKSSFDMADRFNFRLKVSAKRITLLTKIVQKRGRLSVKELKEVLVLASSQTLTPSSLTVSKYRNATLREDGKLKLRRLPMFFVGEDSPANNNIAGSTNLQAMGAQFSSPDDPVDIWLGTWKTRTRCGPDGCSPEQYTDVFPISESTGASDPLFTDYGHIAGIYGIVHDGASWETPGHQGNWRKIGRNCQINFHWAGKQSQNSRGGTIVFLTTGVGSTTLVERLWLNQKGHLVLFAGDDAIRNSPPPGYHTLTPRQPPDEPASFTIYSIGKSIDGPPKGEEAALALRGDKFYKDGFDFFVRTDNSRRPESLELQASKEGVGHPVQTWEKNGKVVHSLEQGETFAEFLFDGKKHGAINKHEANRVSFGSFSGFHWSQWLDSPNPLPPLGTPLVSEDALCYWPNEKNDSLAKCSVCNVDKDPCVYGVFAGLDEEGDVRVISLGLYKVRIKAGECVKKGDILVSSVCGTARPLRENESVSMAQTIGKVTSSTIVERYEDGTYLVPCTIHCG